MDAASAPSGWVPFALLAPALWAASNFIDKVLRGRYVPDSVALSVFTGATLAGLAALIALARGLPALSPGRALLYSMAGLWGLLLIIPYMHALAVEETSRVVSFLQVTHLWVLLFAALFLGETLRSIQGLAFALLLAGAVGMSVRFAGGRMERSHALPWLILTSTAWGGMRVLLRFLYREGAYWDNLVMLGLGTGVGVVGLLVGAPALRRRVRSALGLLRGPVLPLLLATEVVNLGAVLSFLFAVSRGPVALVSVLSGTQAGFAVLYGLLLSRWIPGVIREGTALRDLLPKGLSLVLLLGGLGLLYAR